MTDPTDHSGKVSLNEACKYFVRRPSVRTIWNWRNRGKLNKKGERVFLKVWTDGSMDYTTIEEIRRFQQEMAKPE